MNKYLEQDIMLLAYNNAIRERQVEDIAVKLKKQHYSGVCCTCDTNNRIRKSHNHPEWFENPKEYCPIMAWKWNKELKKYFWRFNNEMVSDTEYEKYLIDIDLPFANIKENW